MNILWLVTVFLVLVGVPASAEAYIGPGLGVGVLGAIFGVIVAIFLAIIGILWYPIKRFILRNSWQEHQGRNDDGP